MDMPVNYHNEQQVAYAFSRQAVLFDELYAGNTIVKYKRDRVREHLLRHLSPAGKILELNAGTGDDAVWLAQQGFSVHATDISAGMQQQLAEKVEKYRLKNFVSNELCSYTALDRLSNKGPYDCIFSNFAGLNCTGDLARVLNSFDNLLRPGGIVVLVMLPKFCLWETLLVLKGKFRTATRRFFSAGGRRAKIEDVTFTCWYYSPRYIKKKLSKEFAVLGMEGLCSLVPPSYIEHFAENHARAFSFLRRMEDRYKTKWPWKYIGDYYIISFRRK
jgi:ubiquinone/menaquinone biosynthesis C-methylase UbiE